MKFNFCSYLDRNYLSRFITLYDTTKYFCNTFYVLALDRHVINFFKRRKKEFKKIILIGKDDIIKEYTELNIANKNRSKIEFYFTLSPYLPKFIFKKFYTKQLIYLDADMYFINKLKRDIFKNKYDIQIVRQGFREELYGKFNVGFILYKNTSFTNKMLNKWSEQCFNCCKDYPYRGTYADQKYLDDWEKYKNIKKLNYDEINLAPWNISQTSIKYSKNNLIVKDKKVFCYHFHGLTITNNYFFSGLQKYKKKILTKDLYNFYNNYVLEIKKNEKKYKLYKLNSQSVRLNYTNVLSKNLLIFLKKIKNFIQLIIFEDKFKINLKN
jgi:hypothetical protein